MISFFYDGLAPKTKKLVETTYNGEFMDKNEDEAKTHFEWLANYVPDGNIRNPADLRLSPKV